MAIDYDSNNYFKRVIFATEVFSVDCNLHLIYLKIHCSLQMLFSMYERLCKELKLSDVFRQKFLWSNHRLLKLSSPGA